MNIPDSLKGALQRYAEHGIMPGGFLTSFLSNDLLGAVGRADDQNIYLFREITAYLYVALPCEAWGSPDAVENWEIKKRRELNL